MLHLFQANQDTLFSGKSAPARGTRFELKNSFNHRKVKSKVSDGPDYHYKFASPDGSTGLRRSRVHSLVIARRSLCPEKLGSNPGQGSKGINFSGWHGLDMSITVTKRR